MVLSEDVGVRALVVVGEAIERPVVRVSRDGASIKLCGVKQRGWGPMGAMQDRTLDVCALMCTVPISGLTGGLAVDVSKLVWAAHRVVVTAVVFTCDLPPEVAGTGFLAFVSQP